MQVCIGRCYACSCCTPPFPTTMTPVLPESWLGTRCFDSMSRPARPAGQARQIPFAKDPCPTWPVYPSDRSNRIQHGASSTLRPQPHRVLSFLCQTRHRRRSYLLAATVLVYRSTPPADTRRTPPDSRPGRRPREPPGTQTDPAHPSTVYVFRP